MISLVLTVSVQIMFSDWGLTSVELCYLEEHIHALISEIF
jgi:hypothetical protein